MALDVSGQRENGEKFATLGMAFMVGTNLVACLVVGAAAGYGLDWWLGVSPFGVAAGVFLGMAAGFVQLAQTASELLRRQERRPKDGPPGSGGAP
ncbi:MAG: AtpZ/AtpI family protein [Candidatus Riflebacteria bacterium]|nr:AtpZ/AtpI family protein [Candidatus Riflebacteria bacterium]